MSLMLDVKTGQTVYIESTERSPIPGDPPLKKLVKLVLRHKKGQVARLEVLAPGDVYVDVNPSPV